jgi:hypothetical protein
MAFQHKEKHMGSESTLEWAVLAPGISLILHPGGRFSVHKIQPFDIHSPFARTHLSTQGSLETARALLAGAFFAGGAAHGQEPRPASRPTLPQVIYRLCATYRTTHATPGVLWRAALAFKTQGRAELAAFVEQKICEETGHDRLALKDLESLGLPGRRLAEAIEPPAALAMVEYFNRLADEPNPVGALGYAYALERSALFTRQEHIDATQAVCPPGVDATRCMRVHSAVGADPAHVAELVEFIAGLAAGERAAIARAVYETAGIMFRHDHNEMPSDEEIIGLLSRTGVPWPLAA